MDEKDKKLNNLRIFSLTSACFFFMFGIVNFLKGRIGWYYTFFGLGVIFVLLILMAPKAMKPIYNIFMRVATVVGLLNVSIMLALLYFMLITPIGVIMRIIGKELLNQNINKNKLTYWEKRLSIKASKDSLEKQF